MYRPNQLRSRPTYAGVVVSVRRKTPRLYTPDLMWYVIDMFLIFLFKSLRMYVALQNVDQLMACTIPYRLIKCEVMHVQQTE